ncbi:MAG: alpha/beta fold hydrolase [Actinomycetota bacterium]
MPPGRAPRCGRVRRAVRRPARLLVEGMGGDVAGWHRNIPALAAERFVIALDLRGNGRSSALEDERTILDLATDALALLDELAIHRADVWGMSMGGLIAQEIALHHPARVRSLVLGCTHPGGTRRIAAAEPVGRFWDALYAPAFLAAHPAHVEEDRAVRGGRTQSATSRRHQRTAARAFDSWDRLPLLDVPTLVVSGTEDRIIDAGNSRLLAERIPGAELVLLDGAGHVFHSERADEVNALVLDFLRRHRDA